MKQTLIGLTQCIACLGVLSLSLLAGCRYDRGGGDSAWAMRPPADGGSPVVPPPADGGDSEVPPPADGGGSDVPPPADGGGSVVPPPTDGGGSDIPPPAGGGGSDVPPPAGSGGAVVQPPAELAYVDLHGVPGQPIPPDVPSSSGGAIASYSITPDLPAGLSLDEHIGVISGAPSAASDAQTYTVTGTNAAGSAQAHLTIEVPEPLHAPANLSYTNATNTYFLNLPISINTPSSSGGPVDRYSAQPLLPDGLVLDATNGSIGGAPTAMSDATRYTITASNDAGSTQTVLSIAVMDQAPSELTYDELSPAYAQYSVVTNTPHHKGGRVISYSVSPILPVGLSLDPVSGVISGRPTAVSAGLYVVTATNKTASTQVTLQITVKFPLTPAYTVGDAVLIPVRGSGTWYTNDSVFPWLPTIDGTGHLAFWGDGGVHRYLGTSFDDLKPASNASNGAISITWAPGVDHSAATGWAANGYWMLTATRTADGTLVGFVHGENHTFADGKYGEWNSTGLLTSQDDGLTWIDHGQVVAEPKPAAATYGGMGLSEVVWDDSNQRWLGYSGGKLYISTDPYASPGSWYGYYLGAFTQHIDVTAPRPVLTTAPGLETANVTYGGLTWNAYLKQYILTWMPNGNTKSVYVAFSPDGLHWGPPKIFFSEQAPYNATYAFIVGDSDTHSGQDCYLVYMRSPPTSGNRNDMIRRPIHFQ